MNSFLLNRLKESQVSLHFTLFMVSFIFPTLPSLFLLNSWIDSACRSFVFDGRSNDSKQFPLGVLQVNLQDLFHSLFVPHQTPKIQKSLLQNNQQIQQTPEQVSAQDKKETEEMNQRNCEPRYSAKLANTKNDWVALRSSTFLQRWHSPFFFQMSMEHL